MLRAQEPSLLPTTSLRSAHGPRQRGLDGVDGLVQIVPVQAQSGLETEGIPRSEAGGVDGRVGNEFGRDGFGVFRRHGDFEAILSGVAASCDTTSLNAIQRGSHPGHERHLRQIESTWQYLTNGIGRTRSLNCQQLHAVLQVLHGNVSIEPLHLFPKVFHIPEFRGAVNDHVNVISRVRNHRIVDDPARFVRNEGQTSVPPAESRNVADDDPFEERGAILPVPADLTHVGYVEEGRLAFRAAPQVFLHHSPVFGLVEDGELVSREGDHVAA
mmetsp:Transcript_6354/g.15824  ORF Transcript_6354/g.15824 Transcript_6354/m.15824 type:complete len:271 (-) Transcript_6354:250-1062(-)